MNVHFIVGNVGNNPTLNTTGKGIAVCNFTVATNKRFKSNGHTQEKTEWHRVQVWGKLAETCAKYLSKGREVAILGESEFQKFTDRGGIERFYTNLKAKEVEFLQGGRSIKTSQDEDEIDYYDEELSETEREVINQGYTGR